MFGRHNDAPQAAPASVFQMHQKMWAIGDDFWIENGAGQRVFKVDGKALRIRKTLELQGPDGRCCTRSRRRCSRSGTRWRSTGPAGRVATVHKKLISPLREHYDVKFEGGAEWAVQGNVVDHQYEMKSGDTKVAEVGKKWFRVRDTYGISVEPGQDPALVIAVAIVVDAMAHPHK